MADSKLSALAQSGTILPASKVFIVNDPGGTPVDSGETIGSLLGLGSPETWQSVGIVSGSATITVPSIGAAYATLQAESGTADDLTGFSGLSSGQIVIVQADAGDTITIKTSGSISTGGMGDLVLVGDNDQFAAFKYDGSSYSLLYVSPNGITFIPQTAEYATGQTFTAPKMYSGRYNFTAASANTLPAAIAGMEATMLVEGGVTVSFDPDGSEVIVLNGTAQTGGVTITTSTSGACASFVCLTNGEWQVQAIYFAAGS